ncbi:DUF3775 domain-containing protein [Bradyrhizobium sp. USDA 336]|uniref:DUF3775 domain-containing protein n=1 Tax=unclassified Bradyrhizobium TaxID=2631580 RepID=UPI003850DE41
MRRRWARRNHRAEFASFIHTLSMLRSIWVALTRIGHGDGDLSDWRRLRAQAAQTHNQGDRLSPNYEIEKQLLRSGARRQTGIPAS